MQRQQRDAPQDKEKPEKEKSHLGATMNKLTHLKDLVMQRSDLQFTGGKQQEMMEAIFDAERSLKLDVVGAEQYAARLSDFKEEGQRLFKIASSAVAECLADDSQALSTFKRDLLNWTQSTFQLKQLAAFSQDPTHDRDAIAWCSANFQLCTYAHHLCLKCEDQAKELGEIKGDLTSLLDSLLADTSAIRPNVFWLLGRDQDCNDFFDFARAVYTMVDPIKSEQIERLERDVNQALEKLNQVMLKDSDGTTDEGSFMKHYTQSKIGALNTARMELKGKSEALLAKYEDMKIIAPLKLSKQCSEQLRTSRFHTVKYGLISLVRHPQITSADRGGQAVRKSLQEAWDAHKDCQEMVSFIGDHLSKLVMDSLSAAQTANVKAKSKLATPAEESGEEPKAKGGKKRAAGAASSSSAPKAAKM